MSSIPSLEETMATKEFALQGVSSNDSPYFNERPKTSDGNSKHRSVYFNRRLKFQTVTNSPSNEINDAQNHRYQSISFTGYNNQSESIKERNLQIQGGFSHLSKINSESLSNFNFTSKKKFYNMSPSPNTQKYKRNSENRSIEMEKQLKMNQQYLDKWRTVNNYYTTLIFKKNQEREEKRIQKLISDQERKLKEEKERKIFEEEKKKLDLIELEAKKKIAIQLIKNKILEYWQFKQKFKEEMFLKRFSFEKFQSKIQSANEELKEIYHRKIYLENLDKIVKIQSRFRMHRIFKVFSSVIKRIMRTKKLMSILGLIEDSIKYRLGFENLKQYLPLNIKKLPAKPRYLDFMKQRTASPMRQRRQTIQNNVLLRPPVVKKRKSNISLMQSSKDSQNTSFDSTSSLNSSRSSRKKNSRINSRTRKNTFDSVESQQKYYQSRRTLTTKKLERSPTRKLNDQQIKKQTTVHRETSLSTILDEYEDQTFSNIGLVARPRIRENSTLMKNTETFERYIKKDNELDDFNYGLQPKYKQIYRNKLKKHHHLLKQDQKSQFTQIDDDRRRELFNRFFTDFYEQKPPNEVAKIQMSRVQIKNPQNTQQRSQSSNQQIVTHTNSKKAILPHEISRMQRLAYQYHQQYDTLKVKILDQGIKMNVLDNTLIKQYIQNRKDAVNHVFNLKASMKDCDDILLKRLNTSQQTKKKIFSFKMEYPQSFQVTSNSNSPQRKASEALEKYDIENEDGIEEENY
ncbi:UNKNOWN [Stylonychia lemnae]|uniref:Uncharacterized protein n=1 Tax=Stylonychia lemnae TaxID=5949 RepID=A0A077ZT67_STYLE|nr:UNKNOWN [Stylonychia lemnae]|eukprot:CDW73077.1 UNKNOWN [Stylonychia lemnae]